MGETQIARLNVADLLAAVENAPPVAAADVVSEYLAHGLGASKVSFLIADFSGGVLMRLGHAGSAQATRTQGLETAERVPLRGSVHGRALAGQDVQIEVGSDGTNVYAPVTNRGEAIGV